MSKQYLAPNLPNRDHKEISRRGTALLQARYTPKRSIEHRFSFTICATYAGILRRGIADRSDRAWSLNDSSGAVNKVTWITEWRLRPQTGVNHPQSRLKFLVAQAINRAVLQRIQFRFEFI
jgi:hypothetical protein